MYIYALVKIFCNPAGLNRPNMEELKLSQKEIKAK
jgi:hypothetical protein